jgi:hypothetical protein
MRSSEGIGSTGSDRITGLLAWWGVAGANQAREMSGQVSRIAALGAELNHHFREVSFRQSEALTAANEEIIRPLQMLVSARQPADVISAQLHILKGLTGNLEAQSRAWADFSDRLHECCCAMAREGSTEAFERAGALLPTRSQSHAEEPMAHDAAAGSAHA